MRKETIRKLLTYVAAAGAIALADVALKGLETGIAPDSRAVVFGVLAVMLRGAIAIMKSDAPEAGEVER